jgi:hypothetical protein
MAAYAAVRVGFVLAGGGLIVVAIAIFAVRWRVLLPTSPSVPVRYVFCYLMIGYMTNAIIPLRLGDLVRAYLLGRRHGISAIDAGNAPLDCTLFAKYFGEPQLTPPRCCDRGDGRRCRQPLEYGSRRCASRARDDE